MKLTWYDICGAIEFENYQISYVKFKGNLITPI